MSDLVTVRFPKVKSYTKQVSCVCYVVFFFPVIEIENIKETDKLETLCAVMCLMTHSESELCVC